MIGLEAITHDYGRGRVLDGIDLAFVRGCVTSICGPNAAGKTTMLRIAAGLLVPSTGRVLLDGTPIGGIPAGRRARRLAFMSQRFECVSGFSVRRVLELARVLVGRDPVALDRVIAELELEPILTRSIGALSVGQCQRVALARALAQLPSDGVLILDEPLAALDPRWQQRASECLRKRAGEGATVLLSVHELPVAARLAQRVVLLADGSLVAEGPSEAVLRPEPLQAAYEMPFELLTANDGTLIPVPSSDRSADTLST